MTPSPTLPLRRSPSAPRIRWTGLAAWAAMVLLCGGSLPGDAAAADSPRLVAGSAILVDAHTGRVLYEKEADVPRQVASTQKLLTALLVVEAGGLDGLVTVDKSDASVEPYRMGIKPGERYTRRDLLTALLMKSGNDLAHCLARDYAGSEEQFAKVMTYRARLLGMEQSIFKTASGLPWREDADAQFSTAREMAKLARAAYANPEVRRIVSTRTFDWKFNDGRVLPLKNSNRLLDRTEYCDGMKTGYTHRAGRCLISSGSKYGHTLLAIVLKSTPRAIWTDSENLLEFGFEQIRADHLARNAARSATTTASATADR